MVEAIRSGGQTGGDQGGLAAAVTLGLRTGGWVPRGWRTDTGPAPWLGSDLGLREHRSSSYPPRTELNVRETDGTLIFGNEHSPGCRLTRRLCGEHDKPSVSLPWKSGDRFHLDPHVLRQFRTWVEKNDIHVLNVAGNRESKNPGITQAVHDFLVAALR